MRSETEPVPIDIAGKTYHMRATFGALIQVKKLTGIDLSQGVNEDSAANLELLPALLWALCGGSKTNLSLEEFEDQLLLSDAEYYTERLQLALNPNGEPAGDAKNAVQNPASG